MVPQSHGDTGNIEDLKIKPNLCFSNENFVVRDYESTHSFFISTIYLQIQEGNWAASFQYPLTEQLTHLQEHANYRRMKGIWSPHPICT